MIIKLAGLPFEWQDEYSEFVKSFLSDTDEKPILKVKFENRLPICHGIQYVTDKSDKLLRLENGEFACANGDWSEVTSYYPTKISEFALPLAAICSKLAFYNAILLHASSVACNENGVLFTGFSGAGKTTQAKLWEKHVNADVINGDKAILREIDGNIYVCGLPWKGSSKYCLNKVAKLKGIVILRQANENQISRLNMLEATEKFMPHVFLPHWDNECLDKAIDTFEKILNNVPVYLLECRADSEAVTLTYNTILG